MPEVEDQELLEEWLSAKRGSKVQLKIPKRGDKLKFLELVQKNAQNTLEQFKLKLLKDKELQGTVLTDLANLLELNEIPYRIEAYDISNIQGFDSVGSMIVLKMVGPKMAIIEDLKLRPLQEPMTMRA